MVVMLKKCFDIVHSDVWGISPFISYARYKYFVTFIDDFSRYTSVYFLQSKSEVLSVFQTFVAYVKTQFSTSTKILGFDSGGEYMSHEFHNFLNHKGIDLPEYHVLLIGMVFPTLLLILLCLLFPSLHAFLRLLNMNVGGKRWMKNFGLSRTIIHGMRFLAPLMLKPLVVNEFTRLSSALRGL
jgi:hypothetical protein